MATNSGSGSGGGVEWGWGEGTMECPGAPRRVVINIGGSEDSRSSLSAFPFGFGPVAMTPLGLPVGGGGLRTSSTVTVDGRIRDGGGGGGSGGEDHEVPPKTLACDPNFSTPRIKSDGFHGSNVRRRLNFSPYVGADEEVEVEVEEMDADELWDAEKFLKNFAAGQNQAGRKVEDGDGDETMQEGNLGGAAGGMEGSTSQTRSNQSLQAEAMDTQTQEFEAIFKSIIASQSQGGQSGGNDQVPPGAQLAVPEQSSSSSLLTSASVVPQAPPAAPAAKEKTGNRRIAQLVVWTKNSSKQQLPKKEATVKEEKANDLPPPPPIPVKGQENENLVGPALETAEKEKDSPKKSDPLGDLFFVQYPVRPLAETSKNKAKAKAQKRARRLSPGSPCKNGSKRKSRKQKRSSSILVQGTSSGRAYRTYLHSCLEKQRQQLRSGADFKVEKLFQPDQGVALPGEILPAITEPTVCLSDLPSSVDIATLSNITSDIPPPPSFSIPPVVSSSSPQPQVATTSSISASNIAPQTVDSDLNPPVVTSTSVSDNCNNICEAQNCLDGSTVEVDGAGDFIPLFELPDRFTVATEPVNEFDLLIQNVIREEMVGNVVEEEELAKSERCRKRMKLSNCSSRASSEDRMTIDEPGKPRCTYTELIEKALTEAGGLTVSEIYTWISERYPFYKPDDDRWKNSVRHNLSINPYFKKGDKARNGAGHLWTISEESKGLRPAMRRKSPSSDLADFIMPIESETDRAVADILGKYISECRANREAAKKGSEDVNGQTNGERSVVGPEVNVNAQVQVQPTGNEPESTIQLDEQDKQKANEPGASCNTVPSTTSELATFNLSELNSGQFTVDLSGITIPEGGAINFEELINNGRLIYIQTDPEANKENESSAQAVVLNECLLSELTALTSNSAQDDARFHSFYSDPLSLELAFGKGSDAISTTSYDASHMNLNACTTSTATSTFTTGSIGSSNTFQQDMGEGTCGQMLHSTEVTNESHNHADLTVMDQVITMSSCDGTGMQDNLPVLPINSAALYESKELGIPYTFQTESCTHDILQ